MFILLGLLLLYALLLLLAAFTSNSLANKVEGSLLKVSVLVPFRNEEQNFPQLIEAFEKQTHGHFEVIFIDDHSTDYGSTYLKERLKASNLNWRVAQVKHGQGKKAALTTGIGLAQNEIIVTTDADCTFGSEWLETLIKPLGNDQAQMVLGPVMLTGSSIWQRIQSLEFTTLMAITKAFADTGKPVMANGANLAYRKSAFRVVNGFSGVDGMPSGDDELLMNKVQKAFEKAVVFNAQPQGLVKTDAPSTWIDFKNQRLRWASKWKVGKRPVTIILALLVMLLQCIQLVIIASLIFNIWNPLWLGLGLFAKLIAEFLFIWTFRSKFKQKTSILLFLLCFLLYPFYAFYFGLAANFMKFEWKGRMYASKDK